MRSIPESRIQALAPAVSAVAGPAGAKRLVYIIGTYPTLTTTFIDREVRCLREWGLDLRIVSIRRPGGSLSPEQAALQQGVVYLLPPAWTALLAGHLRFALRRPRTYWGALWYLLTRPHPSLRARAMTLLHFGEGVYAAHLLRHSPVDHLHAHFVDRAATVALTAGRLLGIPYSVTAHANDIYVRPVLLKEKLVAASFVATCTAYNAAYLSRLGEGTFSPKLRCIRHGLDVSNYSPGHVARVGRSLVLSVGQLKEKKGFDRLIRACRLLQDRGYDLECQIVGEGPLRAALSRQIQDLALDGTVTLCGALPHGEVIQKYAQATLFVLAPVVGADGDRDGIPNVILEAMAMELPVVSTDHSGIPEAVRQGVTGLLVAPGDETALADAIAKLLDRPELAREFGRRGRQAVIEGFDVAANARHLLNAFVGQAS